jgi:hypothetical protein
MWSNKHTLDVLYKKDEQGDERMCELYVTT